MTTTRFGRTDPVDYRALMSGQQRGPVALLMRLGLRIGEAGYRVAIGFRNRRFDRQSDRVISLEVPVISVGNVTTGGTGKTPIVAYLARWYRDQGVRVAIVSRGYGRGDASENDEARELHQRLPDVPHVQDPDRVAAARVTIDELDTQLILMDDGFQHRRLGRDLDLVLIDVTCPFGFGHLLPRGLLREPLESLERADAVILTRCDQVSESAIDEVIKTVRKHVSNRPIVRSTHAASGLLTFPDQIDSVETLSGARVAVFCGIGNPDAFRHSVDATGAKVTSQKILPDHVDYDRSTVDEIVAWVRTLGKIDALVCTQKDLVKLQCDRLGGVPVRALTIEASLEPNEAFEQLLVGIQRQAEAVETIEW
ncbi:tetraacyldisaccharide 4'-kinase [Rhodopirellula sp. MGV]|uniref:tetraacyldisaccharide 4'-kinase n=1 Tax=Rhodopirellula sp. MGV TaxID=2023130 RepID=UPI000B966676|nr:tetraacyldisaccharide 4'-kinase [Rhodopirellula sp. MGV]OYP35157.1 tetraacyldisaccharide 4'-kinase [Rhodopirellula sp. MGV]PNY37828.1 tetraacyldisaccharide 4'-kinase [Rhodopirellula baltica]